MDADAVFPGETPTPWEKLLRCVRGGQDNWDTIILILCVFTMIYENYLRNILGVSSVVRGLPYKKPQRLGDSFLVLRWMG